VSALAPDHPDHGHSTALFDRARDGELAVAAPAVAEAYSTLTRANGLFRWDAEDAWLVIDSVLGITTLVGLPAAATVDAIRTYARQGGIGPRLHDRLIGEVAVQHRIDVILTWNVGHMQSLFPQLAVMSPAKGVERFRA
jgi:predicted nucleic acid-binding protein